MSEEEDEEAGEVGSAARSKPDTVSGLEEHQQIYLDSLDRRIQSFSRSARRRLVRFRVSAGTSLVVAAAVPVAVAAVAPGWIVAALGSVAVVIQGLQQVLQDQRSSVESHVVAVELSRARRRLAYDLGVCRSRHERRLVFDSFVDRIEDVVMAGGQNQIAILREGPLSHAAPHKRPVEVTTSENG